MSIEIASRTTHQAFTNSGTAGALTVASGGNIKVYGFIFQSTTNNGTIFTVTDASDTTIFTWLQVANLTGSTSHLDVDFIADAGLKVQSSRSDGTVTVFHNSPGV